MRLTARTLAGLAPGASVELRIPPFAAVQCISGPEHRRGTPPNVVEADPRTWLLLVTGGGPTSDKPDVVFAPPSDPRQVSHEMTIRVPDCQAAYRVLQSRGAQFLTPPVDWGGEIRCFFRDPDGHLLEISQVVP